MKNKKAADINEYIASFPKSTQLLLEEVRCIIKTSVPQVEETISYAIPAFKFNGEYLIYFAGFKKHIGIYPAPTSVDTFIKDFEKYKTSKGTVQFPLDKPIPKTLLVKIIKYRMKVVAERLMAKKTAGKK